MLNRLRNHCHRAVLRWAYPWLCKWERVSGRRSRVALVAVWYRGRLLVVRHSYRPGSALPGGDCRRGETSRETALRELREEVGIAVEAEALVQAGPADGQWTTFEYRPAMAPCVTIDNREIVAADFLEPAAIADPTRSLARYLARARRARSRRGRSKRGRAA